MILIDKLKGLKNNKAFTLIELIVVIAVIGILVLLAAPKFLGYTKDAKLAQMKNDVRAVENAIEIELVRAEVDDVDKLGEWDWSTIETDKMQKYVDEGSLFDRKGAVNEFEQDEFYMVDKRDISVKSKLKGSFIYAKGGKVFYQDDGVSGESGESGSGGTEGETEEEFVLLTDDDFEFIRNSSAPNEYTVNGETANGYFHYKGEADKIVIPHEIMGNEVKDYYQMFYNNGTDDNGTTVTAVVSDNPSVTNTKEMFVRAQATTLDLSGLDMSAVVSIDKMFGGEGGSLSNGVINSSHVKEVVGIEDWDLSSLKTLDNVFEYSPIENVPDIVKSWGDNGHLDNVTSYRGLFKTGGFKGKLDVGSIFQNVDTSNVTNMSEMFRGSQATSLTDLDKFNTSNVTDMSGMFAGSQATSLDLSEFDTEKVTSMNAVWNGNSGSGSGVFEGSQANKIVLGAKFTAERVESFSDMFRNSKATEIVGLEHLNTSNATQMRSMFWNSQAAELDLSSFDTSKVTDMSNMFYSFQATTGYARTQDDADNFNNSSNKPSELEFTLK